MLKLYNVGNLTEVDMISLPDHLQHYLILHFSEFYKQHFVVLKQAIPMFPTINEQIISDI